jgi:hypothetical protein
MDHAHHEDESPLDFKFPMSKHEKLKHEDYEHNIISILDEEDEKEIKKLTIRSDNSIITGEFPNNNLVKDSEDMLADLNINSEEKTSLDTNSEITNKKKLSILSNNYRPKGYSSKKGKLKKPQSQKEPKLTNQRDFGAVQQQLFGSNIVDNPQFYNNQNLIQDDKEWNGSSNLYSNMDRTTSSS